MKDIADELNLSITTVSFVVNGKSEEKSISPATVKKVNDLIEKRGFNPNSAARLLRTGKSKTIGLIVEDIGNYFFANIAKTVGKAAHKNGYSVILSSTENNDATARELINKMKNSSVDGFIITATHGLFKEIAKLKKENVPFVLLDRIMPGIETNHVILDNYSGGVQLTTHLVNNGYSKIGLVSVVSQMSNVIGRENGFLEAMRAAKLKVPAKTILKFPFGESRLDTIAAIKRYLANNPNLEAVFFTTNDLGVLGIEAIQESNLKIPMDIAVVSFDDNDLFRLLNPSITVAAQPIREIGTRAIELLIKLINGEPEMDEMTGVTIKPTIIIRNSSPKKILQRR
ncbi:MAG: LacI family transcriptional regulator [Ferruginibacter sp.]|nr:LacI family transcriptional regulator [Ferruginibacter sp.]